MGEIYKTALVSLTFRIDIFTYFTPAWQNKMKYVGGWELKNLTWELTDLLRIMQSI